MRFHAAHLVYIDTSVCFVFSGLGDQKNWSLVAQYWLDECIF